MFIRIKVKANSRENKVDKMEGDYLTVKVKSPREKGLANNDLIKTLSLCFSIPKSSIEIKSGSTSPKKMIIIDDVYASIVFDKLSEFS
jgi:uncharacterized protein